MFKIIKKCRFCLNKKLTLVIDLGKQPPANSLQKKFNKQKNIPLKILRCNKCTLLQLSATVKPEYLFSKYVWVTGTSKIIKKYRKFFVNKILNKNKHNKKKLLEVASNDGFFLEKFKKKNFEVIGVDPAKNIASKANKKGIKTLPIFFNEKSAKLIAKKYFYPDIVICRNVVPHVENINGLMKGISRILSEKGKLYIEFHYAENLSKELHYDYIYHEHIFYFTYFSIKKILNKNNLYPIDYFKSPISGGSIVLEISKIKNKESEDLMKLKKYEKKIKINTNNYWLNYFKKCLNHKIKLNNILKNYKKNEVIGYGASARSSTLLNFCNIDFNKIKFIFDINKLKHNLLTAGTNIRIIKPNKKALKNIRCIIILAWNFKTEIISFLKNKLNYKEKIIVVLPKIKKFNAY